MANSRTDGKDEKSSGFCAFIAAISTATDKAMLRTKNPSSSRAGIGMIISRMIGRMPIGSAKAADLGIERKLIVRMP